MSRLDLVVGPNGAGKSTFIEFVLSDVRPGTTLVNADLIAAERWPDDPVGHGHDAALLADRARQALIASGEPFIAETVASHPSKVDLVRQARAAGYHVNLIVVAVPVEYSLERVRLRVKAGGHDVPEDRIRARWARLWRNVADMIVLAHSSQVFDNSGDGPRCIATFVAGEPIGQPQWPPWMPADVTEHWIV